MMSWKLDPQRNPPRFPCTVTINIKILRRLRSCNPPGRAEPHEVISPSPIAKPILRQVAPTEQSSSQYQSVQGTADLILVALYSPCKAMCLQGCFNEQPLKLSDGDAVPVLTSQDHMPFSAGLQASFLAAEKGFRRDGKWCEVSEVKAQHLDSRHGTRT
jgi:hypothetical protein